MSKETKQILTRLRGRYGAAGLEHKRKLLDSAHDEIPEMIPASVNRRSSATRPRGERRNPVSELRLVREMAVAGGGMLVAN